MTVGEERGLFGEIRLISAEMTAFAFFFSWFEKKQKKVLKK